MRIRGWSVGDCAFVGAMLAASMAQPFLGTGGGLDPAPWPVLDGGAHAKPGQRPCGAWSTRPLPPVTSYFPTDPSKPDPDPITCATDTGYVCTVNFNTVCDRGGPQTFGSLPRLTPGQQLNLLQHCANGTPRRGAVIDPTCLRVRWVRG